jgi:GTP-binding protein
MQIEAAFVTSAAGAEGFPRERLPEVALVGRSNVGKSSLINALARRDLARTSAAPGKTRLANFYRLRAGHGGPFHLVDLPGYGYARGGDEAAREFARLTDAYFARDVARGVLLLVDARHPGLESDIAAWTWLLGQPAVPAVVATKVDKLTRAERARHAGQLAALFARPVPLISARTGEGLEELWKLIVKLPNQTATAAP